MYVITCINSTPKHGMAWYDQMCHDVGTLDTTRSLNSTTKSRSKIPAAKHRGTLVHAYTSEIYIKSLLSHNKLQYTAPHCTPSDQSLSTLQSNAMYATLCSTVHYSTV